MNERSKLVEILDLFQWDGDQEEYQVMVFADQYNGYELLPVSEELNELLVIVKEGLDGDQDSNESEEG